MTTRRATSTKSRKRIPFPLYSDSSDIASILAASGRRSGGTAEAGTVVVDVETVPFSADFLRARTLSERRVHAPKPRLVGIYFVASRRTRFFSGAKVRQSLRTLERAARIITFNGERFDFLVLERHCGLIRSDRFRHKCLDLHDAMFALDPRLRVSLDRASRINFATRKRVKGSILAKALKLRLTIGCRSDLQQTAALYRLWQAGRMMHATKPQRDLPPLCPECDRRTRLVPYRPDTTGMTEGQIWDYEMNSEGGGIWGFARCIKCGNVVMWGI